MTTDSYVFENVWSVETDKYKCRIWRGIEHYAVSDSELTSRVRKQMEHHEGGALMDFLMDTICHEGVNSVEITYKATGDGICVHKNWP